MPREPRRERAVQVQVDGEHVDPCFTQYSDGRSLDVTIDQRRDRRRIGAAATGVMLVAGAQVFENGRDGPMPALVAAAAAECGAFLCGIITAAWCRRRMTVRSRSTASAFPAWIGPGRPGPIRREAAAAVATASSSGHWLAGAN